MYAIFDWNKASIDTGHGHCVLRGCERAFCGSHCDDFGKCPYKKKEKAKEVINAGREKPVVTEFSDGTKITCDMNPDQLRQHFIMMHELCNPGRKPRKKKPVTVKQAEVEVETAEVAEIAITEEKPKNKKKVTKTTEPTVDSKSEEEVTTLELTPKELEEQAKNEVANIPFEVEASNEELADSIPAGGDMNQGDVSSTFDINQFISNNAESARVNKEKGFSNMSGEVGAETVVPDWGPVTITSEKKFANK